ncbi:F0F1 ATP synthase subunit gamma [Saccharomonospora viridis]|jgi:F-type H+-transporting ATPase subunit gamma|uniref:ATP synthase gamma chain n=2 Tax=Saccharomonospora viridis TaxID=1852 RepID=C7MX17_SACVD|nr:F0F1 ATP synthase subunit gamma [Saccharomonospora viridis]ACU97934.1 ATP synthase F1 subcomplex gamma subunit [Saccharomonospora viridis DSM 43017]KHF45901.1 F0F1 ATP synthase subunit gamma [Saccharomonospora viridis]SFP39868.1 F-type H+-transporting ATPase subunit gamma [Saccharomonospora viridis]
MTAQLRELRQKVRATKSIGKITKAMELIATSRISKAQARVEASRPYATEITNVLSALAGASTSLDHPLLVERPNPKRVAVLVVTSDKGLVGAYNANVLRATEELLALLREQGKDPQLYVIGTKGVNYYRFRDREIAGSWTGFSQQPRYENAAEVGATLVDAFVAGADDDGASAGADGVLGVDELHIVYTEFRSMLTQTPVARRIAPLEVEYTEEAPEVIPPAYEFEPSAEQLLGALLPKYINTRIYAALLESAASELAAQRNAMKSASDNAQELVETYTRLANQARQAQITQEISEIVGGADALAATGSDV